MPEEPEITEEEFDLSDIMGEELDATVETKEDRIRKLEEQVGALFITAISVLFGTRSITAMCSTTHLTTTGCPLAQQ